MHATHTFQFAGAKAKVLVSSRETAGRYTICEIELAEQSGPPAHAHTYEDALIYVLEGTLEVQIAERKTEAARGTTLFLPRQTTFALHAETAARLLVIAHPGGLDLLFQDLAAKSLPLTQLLEKHGLTH